MLRYTATATRTAVRQATQPAIAYAPRRAVAAASYHSSSVWRAASKPAEEQSAQHPGKSDIEHLENPSLSEEAVHADRDAPDPLAHANKASTKMGEAAHEVSETAQGVAAQAGSTLKKAADAVKDAVKSATGTRSFSTSAVARNDKRKEEDGSPQHLESSGHDHLDKPSVSEEATHADRSGKDPLPEDKKASKKANKSGGVHEKRN
ncbi:hypothetical protein JCM6882_003628 [Rhodosporidiobolus microsporus]